MGNRGLLHDPSKIIRRAFRHKAWLICRLDFKQRRRDVMAPGRYTELFFLDEATALAAGHRPCAECRRLDYDRYRTAAAAGACRPFVRARDLDAILHDDRMGPEGGKRTVRADIVDLPDGTFVALGGAAWLKHRNELHRWTPFGYGEARSLHNGEVDILTPRLSVQALLAGYAPQIARD